MRALLAVLVFVLLPVVGSGHHSRAEFSDQMREIEGVLTEVIWRNPHPALFLAVETEDGTTENWRIEGWSSPSGLARMGVSGDLFVVGQRLTVAGLVSRSRQAILARNALLANGMEALMAPGATSRWDAPELGMAESAEPRVVDAAAENRGFFRVWHPQGNIMMNLRRFSYGDEALAARADWDPVDNPIVRCESPGMPVPLFHPQPILFGDDGSTLSLRHGYFDTLRTIHLDESLDAAAQASTPLGFSQGRWEDERTLIVETTRISYPYFDYSGTLQSDEIAITERYTLSEDQARLDYEVTITDAVALTEPASAAWHYLALDRPYTPYECNVF
jgi:hypothetical protein